MIAGLLCTVAFLTALIAGKKSLGHGLLAVIGVGYFYGITRANIPTTASHFLFDTALLGFYLSQKWITRPGQAENIAPIQSWMWLLVAWPCALSLVPFQNLLVTLVGLRGSVFFLPMMLFGGRLKNNDLQLLAKGLAVLNVGALTVGLLEYSLGVDLFFPKNEVTSIIYASNDLAGGAFRIPSLFVNAHCYAGTMVMTMPLLFGAWIQRNQKLILRQLLILGLVSGLVGVLLSATRLHFVVAACLLIVATLTSKMGATKRAIWVAALILLSVVALGNERLQRFTTLNNSSMIETRINTSVNHSFWDLVRYYPLGNGLGGGGTSMPYFLQNQVNDPIGMENEYARIVAEQGVLGLILWSAFIGWHLFRRSAFRRNSWRTGRVLLWFACTMYFGMALIGTGLLTAIPQTAMLLLFLGWTSTEPSTERIEIRKALAGPVPVRRPLTSAFSP